ncbi:MAG TPA: hypothetical protein VFI00_11385 [Kribbella sp.]|nr:hypothetical protein [Kribbella sp.]
MRYRVVAAAVALVASGLVFSQPAQATTSATCSLNVPTKLVMRGTESEVFFHLGSDCPKNLWSAAWKSQAGGVDLGLTIGCADLCSVLIRKTAIGRTTNWVPVGFGEDSRGRKIADLRPATSMTRYASAAALSGVRRGTKTTLTATASYYSAKTNTFVRRHDRVLLQYQNPGTTTWSNLTYVTPNASGVATYTLTTNRSRAYRVYVRSSTSVWYSYSAPITR